MATLEARSMATSGSLVLRVPLRTRIGSLLFTGFLIGCAAVLIYFSRRADGRVDWGAVIMLLLFFVAPALSGLWNALVTTTITLERTTRTITRRKSAGAFTLATQTLAFADLAHIELMYVPKSETNAEWHVTAVARNAQRLTLNTNGTQGEMDALARQVASLTGAPMVETKYRLPPAMEKFLRRLAPESAQPASPAPTPVEPAEPLAHASPLTESLAPEIAGASPTQSAWEATLGELERRVAADTQDADARYVLARRLGAHGDWERALELLQATLRLDPLNGRAQNDLGVALQARGKLKDAEAAYRRALALEPFAFEARLNLALLLRAQKRAVEASQELLRARQNARGADEQRLAEMVSAGGKSDPRLSGT